MDRTSELEALTSGSGRPRTKRYTPLDDVTILVDRITKFTDHLNKNGHNYLNTYGCLPGASIMTDEWRNKFDKNIEDFINICNEKKKILESEVHLGTTSQQVIQHRQEKIEILRMVLKEFVNYYTRLRMTRMRRCLEMQKYDMVECETGRLSPSQEYESINSENINLEAIASLANVDKSGSPNLNQSSNSTISVEDCRQQSLIAAGHEISISPDEIQTLAFENSQIHDELLTLDDDIKMIGKKVVQISKLQELFTEKVMEQEVELNNLHEVAIRSSENVREGNDLLRDAMMKNASTRVFILFYIITLGFTILFLDWYNP